MATLELRALTKRFRTVAAVDQVHVRIESGEFFSLLGPSGCGKSTILNMISGFVEPTEGEVLVDEELLNDVPVEKRSIGLVFQHYALFPHMTVFENVAFGLKMRKLARDTIRVQVRRALELVRLDGYEDRYPQQLSGGQQQRVALARSVVIQPRILLLDEPLGALDKKLREEMQVELKQLQKTLGVTTVFVTHDQEEALTLSSRIAVMKQGKIVQMGTPEEVYENPSNHFVAEFIGTSNFFQATAVDSRRLETSTGFRIATSVPVRVGERVEIAVRPEKIRITRQKPSHEVNCISASLREIIYLGSNSHFHFDLDCGGARIVVYQQVLPMMADLHLRPGDRVFLEWDEENSLVMEPGEK